jgi:diguanylate cyclase (GGDEF)-like protein/PAS domain S-box-containing protein
MPIDAIKSHQMQTSSEEFAQVADNSAAPTTVWHSRTIRLLILCGVLLAAVTIAVTSSLLLTLRNRDLAESESNLKSLVLVLAEQIDRSFQSIELIQASVVERIKYLGIASAEDYKRKMSGHDIHLILKSQAETLPLVEAIVLTDAQGKLINFSRSWPIPSVKVPNEDASAVFKSDPHLTSFLGDPFRSPVTGNWIVSIARKLTGPNGEFLGVVQGVVELQYLEKLFEAIVPTSNSSIALFRRDGTLLVRYPRQETAIGQPFRQSGLFANVLSKYDHGTVRQIGVIDGQERLISARSLAHYPVVLVVTTTVADALANWKRETITMIGMALMIGIVISGVVSVAAWRIGKKINTQNLRLDMALSNMLQGLAMVDASMQVVVWNERYREMYKYPPDVLKPGCTVFDLLRYRAATGAFSGNPEQHVRDFVAKMAEGKRVSHEVETADGRYIAVVHKPMAGGGWVVTHEDITERKKIEKTLLQTNQKLIERQYAIDKAVVVAFTDVKGNISYINNNFCQISGYARDELLGKNHRILNSGFHSEAFFREIYRQINNGQVWHGEICNKAKDGSLYWLDTTIIPQFDPDGKLNGHMAIRINITNRKRSEDELRQTKLFLDTVIENVPIPIAVKHVPNLATDARDCRFTLLNLAGEELLGVPREQVIGKTAAELYSKETADRIIANDSEALNSKQMTFADDYPFYTPMNGTRLVTSRKFTIRNEDGKPQHLLAVLDDVTERRRSEQRILHMAHYDALTDLPNRVTFAETINATLNRSAASGEQFAVLSIDLDRFKEANDTYGHLIGDAVLREVARRLQAAAEGAFLARIGGDEFMLIVADGAQPAAAATLAGRLLATLVHDIEAEGHHIKLGMSIGGAVYPADGLAAKTLMINADAALYRAKAETRGAAMFFEPEMSERLCKRRELQEDLRSAIDRGELLLHYQPQVRMTGETIGFEALARWQCPKRGMVSPGTFIPVAEESGLILTIGEWVVREACREAASWPQPLTIAVNVSPMQFRHGDLPRVVHSILLETGLAPGRLELEITEGVMINDFSRAISILNRLKSLGVKIAMDDFGTGYSSLSYLQAFRYDKIKIDRVFISDLETNHHSRAIVRAAIGLGKSLDLLILAEGVETEAHTAFLVQEGCDEVQGYLTGRPFPIADYAVLVGRSIIAQQNYAVAG